jgi:hypothetical protein
MQCHGQGGLSFLNRNSSEMHWTRGQLKLQTGHVHWKLRHYVSVALARLENGKRQKNGINSFIHTLTANSGDPFLSHSMAYISARTPTFHFPVLMNSLKSIRALGASMRTPSKTRTLLRNWRTASPVSEPQRAHRASTRCSRRASCLPAARPGPARRR